MSFESEYNIGDSEAIASVAPYFSYLTSQPISKDEKWLTNRIDFQVEYREQYLCSLVLEYVSYSVGR